jgi:hypothetical protein
VTQRALTASEASAKGDRLLGKVGAGTASSSRRDNATSTRDACTTFSNWARPDANVAMDKQGLEQKFCPERSRMDRMSRVASIFSCIHALEASATSDVGCAHAARSSLTQIAPADARGGI